MDSNDRLGGGEMTKPEWWPECPYPEDIFPMTLEEYIKAVPDPNLRTAISVFLMRYGWEIASSMIYDRFQEHKDD